MKVNKLTSANQPENWLDRITGECSREYRMDLVDIQADELVIDAGCNVGGFSKAFSYRLNNVLAIDASSYNIEQYQKIHHHPTLHKALYSVDDEVVKLQKYMVGEDDTNSGNYSITGYVNNENGHGWNSDEYEEVQTISLETLTKEYDSIGLLKIDIEGAEWDFLYGKDLSKIKYITGEFHNFLFHSSTKGKQLLDWIEKTHEEIYSDGDGNETHYIKLFKRK